MSCISLNLNNKLEDFLSGWFRQAASQTRDTYPKDTSINDINSILIENYNQIAVKIPKMIDDALSRLKTSPEIHNIQIASTPMSIKVIPDIIKALDEIESFLLADKSVQGLKTDIKGQTTGKGLLAISYGGKQCVITMINIPSDNLTSAIVKLSFAHDSFSIKLCKNSSNEMANIISLWFREISHSIILSYNANTNCTLFIDTGTGALLLTEKPKFDIGLVDPSSKLV